MCFVWISEQTAIISLYSIHCLVFIAETECVYCAVRTGSLYIKQIRFVFKGVILFELYYTQLEWNKESCSLKSTNTASCICFEKHCKAVKGIT
jgi:hypothetical protein